MKLFEYIDRITLMNKLIKEQSTGTPDEFAATLGIKRTRLYEMVDELKSFGAPIQYSKRKNSFYYEYPYDISLKFILHPLSKKDCIEYNGGTLLLPFFFYERYAPTLVFIT